MGAAVAAKLFVLALVVLAPPDAAACGGGVGLIGFEGLADYPALLRGVCSRLGTGSTAPS